MPDLSPVVETHSVHAHVVQAPIEISLFTIPQCCVALGITRPTLERILREDRTFPRPILIGRRHFLRVLDVKDWIEAKVRAA